MAHKKNMQLANKPKKFRGDPRMGIRDDVIRKKPIKKQTPKRKIPFRGDMA